MNLRQRLVLATTVSAVLAATPTFAQDITGFVGFDGGPDWQFAEDNAGYHENGPGNWTAAYGRLGLDLAVDWSLQFDAWLRRGGGEITTPGGSYTWDQLQTGGAVHATYRSDNFLGGVAGSIGGFSGNGLDSTLGTVALEGGFDFDQFSVIGQIGYTGALGGHARNVGHDVLFAAVDAVYYLTPDFSVSAQLSQSQFRSVSDAVNDRGVTALAAGIEYKLPDAPLIMTGQYMIERYDYVNDPADFYAVNQRVTVGLRVPFGTGAGSLRELDRATGLEHPAGYYNR